MLEEYASYKLEQKYNRTNRIVVLMVIVVTTLTASVECYINYAVYAGPLMFVYGGFITLCLVDFGLFLYGIISVKKAYLILVYPLFFVILIPDLKLLFESESKYIATYAFQAALFCVLYVAVCAFIVRGIHPYLITAICITAIVYAVFTYNDPFIINKAVEIIAILAGFVICQGIYVRLSHNVFIENKTAIIKITEQKKYIEDQSDRLNQAYRELKEVQHLKNSLIESIIHDLKNPLNAILNYSSSVISKSNSKKINESGRQMLVLVENILDVHHMEKIRPKFDIQPVNLQSAIREAVNQVDFLMANRGLSVEYNLTEPGFIMADPGILVRVLVNLLTNAIKYSNLNGIIYITSKHKINGDCVFVKVRDFGSGIPIAYKDKVFDMFTRFSTKTTSSEHSSGIGLTFCKMSLKAMDGNIWVSDTSDKGTTMTFSLPASNNKAALTMKIEKQRVSTTLPDEALVLLKPVVSELKTQNIYKAGRIIQRLSVIDTSQDIEIERWVDDVKSAIFTANQTRYTELLNQATNH
ncbi:sensor histidine kinase [Ancylomarina sp. YFZ004]